MKRTSCGLLRRVLAASVVVTLASLSACGSETTDEAGGSSASSSPSSSPSPSSSAAGGGSGAGELGAAADGECGGGDIETQVVKAAQGVQLTVPADWRIQSAGGGADTRLFGPDEDALEGQMVVQDKDQSLDQAVKDVERLNSSSEKAGEQDLQLSGFESSKLLLFTGEGYTNISVIAVGRDGVRALAYAIVEGAPEDEATVASCLSTLTRG